MRGSSRQGMGRPLTKADRMLCRFIVFAATLIAVTNAARAESPAPTARSATSQPTTLFNGWRISPAGTHVKIESMPLKMTLSPDGKRLAAVCGGLKPGVAIFDTASRALLQFTPLPRSWNGIAYSTDGRHLFVSGGNSRRLYRFDVGATGKLGEPRI